MLFDYGALAFPSTCLPMSTHRFKLYFMLSVIISMKVIYLKHYLICFAFFVFITVLCIFFTFDVNLFEIISVVFFL